MWFQEERQRLRCIIEESTAPIFGVTTEGKIDEWNKVSQEAFGFTAAEVVGTEFVRSVVHPEASSYVQKLLAEIERDQEDQESACVVRGPPWPVSCSPSPSHTALRDGRP